MYGIIIRYIAPFALLVSLISYLYVEIRADLIKEVEELSSKISIVEKERDLLEKKNKDNALVIKKLEQKLDEKSIETELYIDKGYSDLVLRNLEEDLKYEDDNQTITNTISF